MLAKWREQYQTLQYNLVSEHTFDYPDRYSLNTFGSIYCEQYDGTLTVVQPGSRYIGRPKDTKTWALLLTGVERICQALACDYSEQLLLLVTLV